MPTLLKQLELEELSLVDRPANAQAMVSLFKRDNSEQEDIMTEKLEKDLKDAEAKIVDLTTETDTLKDENERLRKALLDAGFVIKADSIEKKEEPELIEVEGEMVAKSDIPAPVLKALEVAAVEKADVELTKLAGEALPNFEVSVAKTLVKKFADDESVMEALKAADKTFEKSMEELGESNVDGDLTSASDKLEEMVKSYMTEHKMKKSDYARAYAEVAKTDEGKALINKSYKGE